MVQSQVLRRTRDSIQKIEDRTRQSIARIEQRLHLKRKAVVRALASLCLPILALIITLIDPVPKLGKLYMRMAEGYNGYAMWEKPPIGSYARVFLFNVTNAEQFLSGEDHNLKLEEIGPFTYLEDRTNSNMTMDWERRVVRFIPRINISFVPDHSIGHPRDFRLIVPNIPLLTATSMLVDYSIWTNIAFNILVKNLGTKPFKNLTAEEYIWGFSDDLMNVAHNVLPGWISSAKLGLLQEFYDGYDEKFVEMEANEENCYQIRSWYGETSLPYWADSNKTGSSCNSLQGSYEGLFFSAGFNMDTKFNLYRRQTCRTIPLHAVGSNYTSFGVKVLQFTSTEDAFDPKVENDCICKNGKCLPRGLSDLSPCFKGMTVAMSMPHFLDCDPSVFHRLEGLSPDRSKHGTLMSIDPEMGLPLIASSSSQTNLLVGDAKHSSIARQFSNITIPIFWLNMLYQDIPDDLQLILRWRFIFGPTLITVIELLLLISGVLVLAYNVFRYLRPGVHMDYQSLPTVAKEMELYVHNNPLMDDVDL